MCISPFHGVKGYKSQPFWESKGCVILKPSNDLKIIGRRSMIMSTIVVVGSGMMGSALAVPLCENSHRMWKIDIPWKAFETELEL